MQLTDRAGMPKRLRTTAKHSIWPGVLCTLGSLACLALCWPVPRTSHGQSGSTAERDSSAVRPGQATIERGRYLVHEVAHCVDCHTPRDSRGQLLTDRMLTGAPIPLRGPQWSDDWAFQSASLAGLGNYETAFIIRLLTKGQRFDGSRPRPPMPVFHLTDEDAEAVVAYLQSLPTP